MNGGCNAGRTLDLPLRKPRKPYRASMGPTKECLGCDRTRIERSQQREERPTATAKAHTTMTAPTNQETHPKVRSMTTCQHDAISMQDPQLTLNSFRKSWFWFCHLSNRRGFNAFADRKCNDASNRVVTNFAVALRHQDGSIGFAIGTSWRTPQEFCDALIVSIGADSQRHEEFVSVNVH